MALGEKILPLNIEEEMKTKYIDYSMSVISRALPDVGTVKPVHKEYYMECMNWVSGPQHLTKNLPEL